MQNPGRKETNRRRGTKPGRGAYHGLRGRRLLRKPPAQDGAEKGCAMKRYPAFDPCRPGPPPGCCPPPCCPPPCCPPRCGGQGSYPVPVPFVPGRTYYAGQVVIYRDEFYLVKSNDPQGVPGYSDDFAGIPMTPMEPDIPGRGSTGPTGPTGPAGPAGGAPGATGPTEAGKMRRRPFRFDALLVQSMAYNIIILFCGISGILPGSKGPARSRR